MNMDYETEYGHDMSYRFIRYMDYEIRYNSRP